jgi:nucleoside-diphosphate-sugar epimerase
MNETKTKEKKILIPGGAGLVGQNLVLKLQAKGYANIIVLDKHRQNLSILKQMHPNIFVSAVDLANEGAWFDYFESVDSVVMLQAQIGAKAYGPYVRNTVMSTRNILKAMREHHVSHLVHISSSVLKSNADDYYVRSKREQENMVVASGVDCVVLRPTLMFGWFDRKHLGWLSRFMKRIPIFPIPGDGRYLRQPLYVGDFCDIIVACIAQQRVGGIYPITGIEKIDYIDIIRTIRETIDAKTKIVNIPYWLFATLLGAWAMFDNNPPFTVSQLKALVTPDVFEVIDWPDIFGVKTTPFITAIRETFLDPIYSKIDLEF